MNDVTLKPGLPVSPLPAMMQHEGHFQQLYPESMLREFGVANRAFERSRIMALLDSFADQCTAQRTAMASDGIGDPCTIDAQLDAVRMLREAIFHDGTPA